MRKLIACITMSLVLLSNMAFASKIEKIYVFGDSLSDTGNLYSLVKHRIPVSPPYFNGHFSNGLMWPEYLTMILGLPVNSLENLSFGGAKTRTNGRLPPPGLDSMLANYLSEHPRIKDHALHIIWMGANNYLRTTKPSVEEVEPTVNDLVQSVWQLVNRGAKDIIVMNVPDIGNIPYAQTRDATNNNTSYSTSLSTASREHNRVLALRMNDLASELSVSHPEVKLLQIDVLGLMGDLLTNAEKYRISEIAAPCYKGAYYIFNNTICDDRDGHLYWDNFHPTTKVHAAIAHNIKEILLANGYTISNPLHSKYFLPDDSEISNLKLYGDK